jgi:signal transduction histidine kinase
MKNDWRSKFGEQFDRLFLSAKLMDGGLIQWKARLLISVLLFLFIAIVLLEISFLIFPDSEHPPLVSAILLAPVVIFIFKKTGNFLIAGNVLAAVPFFILLFTISETGGLFSDNLLWLMISPLIAILFTNRISGFIWLTAIVGYTIYLFQTGQDSPAYFISKIQEAGTLYYVISYAGLFALVVSIVLLFGTGQSMIIKALDEKQVELKKQKAELAEQKESLQKAQIQLKAINEELEQFAYAASHDLKEPLRMIKMYTQFIEKRLQGQLDSSTQEYIDFVTGGVTRMERLLTDLLDYSRLGRSNRKAKDTDLNDILLAVINNMMASMQENDAAIVSNELPVIKSTSTEMIQLFQNLISNSIKFRQQNVNPVIEIKHEMEGQDHHFYFMDNGIGIPKEACDRVFNIFERLHSKSDYEGTGIGLATCKKIVDNMGGKIWVEPGKNKGTTFQIIIPKNES